MAFVLASLILDGTVHSVDAQQKLGPMVETTDPMEIMPDGNPPAWAPSIDPQMLAVIEELQGFEQPALPEMTAFEARMAKTPTNAVEALLKKTGMPPRAPTVDIAHHLLPIGIEGILVRTYTPVGRSGPLPVIVYYHGGGWVIADLDTYEAGPMALAEKAGAVVVSVAYRQAPENPFPAAHEDAFAAYRWVVENTAMVGGDPNRIATAGESAGGNLAVSVALMARERGVELPVHIVSVYPIADGDIESASYERFADAAPLSRAGMEWFFDQYKPDWKSSTHPWISIVDADLSGLPPVTVINAEIDPLEAEGGDLADRLEAVGNRVARRSFMGVTHEFFGMSAVLEQAVEAQDFAAARLTESFNAN